MKRIISLLIITCLLLCACGGAPEETVPPTTQLTEETAPAEETTAPVVTEPVPVNPMNPLTGETLDEVYTARPIAIVINNLKACLPQYGISKADMIYEVETEGGITRMLAIFTDLSDVDSIGPVRSARTYFNNVSASYDIPLAHCGGSAAAMKAMYDRKYQLDKWDHIDQMSHGSYFYRDKDRQKQGYDLEHTLFTTGEGMIKALEEMKYNTVTEGGVSYGLNFSDSVSLNGQAANNIKVTFRAKKTTSFTYDEGTGLYKASQYGKDHVDAGAGTTMAYKNVLVLHAAQRLLDEGKYTRSYYNLVGEGSGYFACNGQMISIKWIRKTITDPFQYTLEDGTPLTLGIGKSYVAIVDKDVAAPVCE